MDPVQSAKDEMGGVESFIAKLPGIKGYREKELRRDADKQVRENLARRLESRRRKLTALQSDLLGSGGLAWMDDVERVVGRLQLFIDRIKTASYGYAPMWALNRVKEDDLDRLIAFDQDLYNQMGPLDEAIGKLEQSVQANEGIKEALRNVADLLSALNETFTRRSEVIQNVQG
jgi:hypothetical protein